MLRKLSMFYDGDIWKSLDRRTLSEIRDEHDPLYKKALRVALGGAKTVSPVASRYSARFENYVWHISFESANLPYPNDKKVNGFAYTKTDDENDFTRIHFTQADSKKILFVIDNHYRQELQLSWQNRFNK